MSIAPRLTALAAVMLAFFAFACGSADDRRFDRQEEVEDDMVQKASQKTWIDFTSETDPVRRRALVKRAIKMSRSPAAAYYAGIVAAMQDAVDAARAERPAAETAPRIQEEPESAIGPNGEPFSFEFRDANLKEIVYLVAGELEMNVLVPFDMTDQMTVSFPAVDARLGLDTILDRYGYQLAEHKGIHVVERLPEDPRFTETIALKTGIQLDLKKELTEILGKDGSVSVEPGNRAVVVTATQRGLDSVRAFLAVIDKRPRQVLIEAVIVEVARSDSFRKGSLLRYENIEVLDSVAGFNSSFPTVPLGGAAANPFTLGIANAKNAIEFMLSADEGITRLNVMHSPFLSTVSGKKSTLKVTEQVPYIKATTSIGAAEGQSGGTLTSAEEVEFAQTGVTLEVTANIGDDDIVEMTLKPKVEELVGFLVSTPVIDTREAETTIMVRNRETVIIGGLLRNQHNFEESKVPILGDIPIIGELFKKQEETDEKIELMLFVTPHLLGYGFEPYKGFQAQDHFLGEDKEFNHIYRVLNRKDRDHFTAPGEDRSARARLPAGASRK